MRPLRATGFCIAALLLFGAAPAVADHSWSTYHWPNASGTLEVKLGDSVGQSATTDWDALLAAVAGDWSASAVVDTPIVPGLNATNPKRCKPDAGRIEACNAAYGWNGWLGLAQIWVSGSHIEKAVAKVNDTYLDHPFYASSTPGKRQVLCQEVGHTLGLDHQHGVSCMNDENDLVADPYPVPNAHDYDQLALIYDHTDETGGSTKPGKGNGKGGGSGNARRVRDDLYVEDLGGARKRFTWVFWKDERASRSAPSDRLP